MIDEKVLINDLKAYWELLCATGNCIYYKPADILAVVFNKIEEQPTIQPQGIDKDRLIELLNTDMSGCDGDFAEEMAEIIIANMQQPTSDGWIPCSERLPDKSGVYITTIIWSNKPTQSTGSYDAERKEWGRYSYDPIAWMEWPQPYKDSE